LQQEIVSEIAVLTAPAMAIAIGVITGLLVDFLAQGLRVVLAVKKKRHSRDFSL
jgi:hypothetical protein